MKNSLLLTLAVVLTLCWSGLSLAADAKKEDASKAAVTKEVKKADTKVKKTTKKAAQKAKALSKPININKASAKELAQFNGIGDKLAKRIVDYRTKNGPFKTQADLMKVKGIGQKVFDNNKKWIAIK